MYDAVAAGAAAAALGRSPHGGGRGAGDWGDVVDAVNGGRVVRPVLLPGRSASVG